MKTTLSRDQWAQVEALFQEATVLAPAGRALVFEGVDASVHTEVEAMLAAVDRGGEFLERPASVLSLEWGDAANVVAAGLRLGPWRVLHLVGRGGMGEVYEAERADGHFQQRAAIKFLSHHSASLLRRFQLERQILARLNHPGIARLLDGGVTPWGQPYAVMEYIVGQTIVDWCSDRRASLAERLQLFLQVCRAVAYAHSSLIVHRDLKPSNILVDADGRMQLLDFGIAKPLDDPNFEPSDVGGPRRAVQAHTPTDGKATHSALAPLTPEYAAPEQLSGGPITTATDVHALGLLLFELLTGRRWKGLDHETPETPVAEATASQAAAQQRTPPVAPKLLRGDLDAIIATCLQPDPNQRYASVDALKQDIERTAKGEAISVRRGQRIYSMARFVRRHRAAMLALCMLMLLSTGFSLPLVLCSGASLRVIGDDVRRVHCGVCQRSNSEPALLTRTKVAPFKSMVASEP